IFDVFQWFSDGYIAIVPGTDGVIGDMRYASLNGINAPFWGIDFRNTENGLPSRWRPGPNRRGDMANSIWGTLVNGSPDYIPLKDYIAQLNDDNIINTTTPDGS